MKKILSILIIMFSLFSAVSYAETNTKIDTVTAEAINNTCVQTINSAVYSVSTDKIVAFPLSVNDFKKINVATTSATTTYVAVLQIFSDPTKTSIGSSGLNIDAGTHSFITVKNISSSNITVGGLSGIAPQKTISVGTWANKSEHKGVWYNLEARLISDSSSMLNGRVSTTYKLTSDNLSTLSKCIKNNDWWYASQPCSYWAGFQWNGLPGTPSLEVGFPISTPKTLADSIKAISGYFTCAAVPYDYVVYYANGSGAPIRSKSW